MGLATGSGNRDSFYWMAADMMAIKAGLRDIIGSFELDLLR